MTICEVSTPLGLVRGVNNGGVLRFTGIPYAKPPVDELRFCPPEPVAPWNGVLPATGTAVVAPQGRSRLVEAVGDFTAPQSEDCLQLCITTPAIDTGHRPVLVWLHGGGYSSGGGGLDIYDGSVLSREGDVVVVGVNYRLGPFGFLRVEGLGEGDAGLLDMIEALRWIRDNIAVFGGDPGNVTVFGQSAGAHCTMIMLTMPEARGLFHRAILQSPPAGVAPLSADVADHNAALLGGALGHTGLPPDTLRRRLTEEPAGRLVVAARQVAQQTAVLGVVAPPFLPVVNRIATPEQLLAEAVRGAMAARIPLIIGTTRDEARAMIPRRLAVELVAEQVQRVIDAAAIEERPGLRQDAATARRNRLWWVRRAAPTPPDVLADVMTDRSFTAPVHEFASAFGVGGGDVWVYRLDWAPPASAFGACHCLDLPLVFGTAAAWAHAPMIAAANPCERDAIATLVRGYWLGFARHGEPAGPLPWPRYDHDRRTMIFDTQSGCVGDPAGFDL